MRAQPFLLAAVFFAFAGIAYDQDRPQWVRHVIAAGFPNQTAVAGDFTGDGRLDVITGDITPNRERTILYVAPEWKPVVLHSGIRTIHGAVIDIDGNGTPDFLGARYHPGLVYWLERPADPLKDPWLYHLVDDAAQGGADGVHGLWAGDIDRDGKMDLAASSGQPKGALPDSLVWFRIPVQPRTAARWERYLVADRDAPGLSHYVALSDVNGDGSLDLAAAAKNSPGGNWFAWWEQGADPRKPWKKHLIASDQFGATNIQIADLNGDGKVDFIGSRGHGTGLTRISHRGCSKKPPVLA
jgi:VCBS repeat protein